MDSSEQDTWQHIVLEQARQRPKWLLQDIYKLAFQAALGSEHAAPSEAAARRWLESEVAELGSGPPDPAVERISPDDRIARINLRPYLDAGGSLDTLLEAFLLTARVWQGNRDTLQQYIDWIVELIELGELDFQSADAQIYFGHLAEAGYPPAHHSATYRDLYCPAYRVVLLDLLPFHP